MGVDLRFWNRWIKSSSDGEYHQIVDLILDEAVFWCTVVLLITITAVILGYQLAEAAAQKPNEQHIALFALLWQALLQLLVTYCAVVPVLREQRLQTKKGRASSFSSSPSSRQQRLQRTKGGSGFSFSSSPSSRHQQQRHHAVIIRVHYSVFYGCVVASVVAMVLAPVLLSCGSTAASNVANFASNIFSAIAASQLAAGITSGLRSRE
ncbi:hypothetical protein PG993_013255 [Apiospora rasikravindrae]|uniref:Uncharacterized protein n=1 Tax=Apiospora rasikravindrae TaxID=990691 RepID=A0ABR1RX73_9PEZI